MKRISLLTTIVLILTVTPHMTNAQETNEIMDATEQAPDANPNEIRRGVKMGGEEGKSRTQVYFERIISKVEPDLKGDPGKLDVYTQLFERELISNPRLFATDVTASWDEAGQKVVLEGHVNFQENHEALAKLFKYLKFENVENNVEVLPSKQLGSKKYAFITVPRTLTYDAPTEPRETMTEGFLGDPVFLLKPVENNHFLIAATDGYISYIDGNDIVRVTGEEFQDYQSGVQGVVKEDHKLDRGEKDESTLFVPTGAQLKFVEETEEGQYRFALPGPMEGIEEVVLPEDDVTLLSPGPDPRALAALEEAIDHLGVDYVWGGKSSAGIDCSGLVQTAYLAQGMNIARDTYMQAYAGKLVATRWYRDGLRKGDLVYFLGSSGRITHTAIYAGDGQYIEASGKVKYSSLNPEDDNYDKGRDEGFCFAKRLFR